MALPTRELQLAFLVALERYEQNLGQGVHDLSGVMAKVLEGHPDWAHIDQCEIVEALAGRGLVAVRRGYVSLTTAGKSVAAKA